MVYNIYIARDEVSKQRYLLEEDFADFLKDLLKKTIIERKKD